MSSIGIDIRNIGKKRTGDEVVFFNLVKNLAVIDKRNSYLLFTDITDEDTLKKIEDDLDIEKKANFKIISLSTINRFVWNFWTLQKYFRKNPLDIYLTQYITPFFVPKTVKIITIIHDISFNFFPQFIKKSDLFFLKTLIPISLRRADKIIGVSRFTQNEIIKYYKVDPAKVNWIHNAVSTEFTQKATELTPNDLDNIRKKYNLPEKYILYLGTLQPRKNLPTLVEAFSKIEKEAVDVKLVLAGGKSHNYDLRIDESIKKYSLEKDVILPGFIDEEDKAAIISGAKIFCFPSFYEGFGIPILEAMSVGAPVVASDIPPHREISGDAAVFFDPEKPEDLAEKIESVLKSEKLRNDLVQKGFGQAKKFSWSSATEKMLGIFEGL